MDNEKNLGGGHDAQELTEAEEVLGSVPSFEEHMKKMNWAEMRKQDYETQKEYIMNDINTRLQNGEKIEDIQRSHFERDQKLIDENDPMNQFLTEKPLKDSYSGVGGSEIVQNQTSKDAEKVNPSSKNDYAQNL